MARKYTIRRIPRALTAPMFRTLTRQLYPRTIEESFIWATELWQHHGLYAQALRRAVRYFMTNVEITADKDLDYNTRRSYLTMLNETFNILGEAAAVGDDTVGWGNAWTSVYMPYVRNMICPKCQATRVYRAISSRVKFSNGIFTGICDACSKSVTYQVKDLLQTEQAKQKLTVNRWPPQFISLKKHPMSGRSQISVNVCEYEWLTEGVMRGDPIFLEDTPMEIIKAIVKRNPFVFKEDQIYHMSLPLPAALECDFKGFGLPLFMNEFEEAMRVVLLDRMNEAIMMDAGAPFKLLSPPAQAIAGANPNAVGSMEYGLSAVSMGDFASSMKSMLAQHINNPTGYHFSPHAVQYQQLGGNAKDLVNVELMEHHEQRLLRSMGIPQEFYTSSLNSAGPLIGLKMFEREWQFFGKALDQWITWLTAQQGKILNWQRVHAHLVPVSIYDSDQDKQLIMELNSTKKVSDGTALPRLGINPVYEKQMIADEEEAAEILAQEKQDKLQKRNENKAAVTRMSPGAEILQAQQQQQAAQGGGGAPPAGAGQLPGQGQDIVPEGGSQSDSISQLYDQAQQIAQQLFTVDPLTRRQQLTTMKNRDEKLYNQVKGVLENMRQQAATQGVRQAQQPQQGAPQ